MIIMMMVMKLIIAMMGQNIQPFLIMNNIINIWNLWKILFIINIYNNNNISKL